jgi:hypothetical protein
MILKLMLLLVMYNVRSERELMQTLPMRLDWLWFFGLDLDSDIPDHSVLSNARSRWGVDVFRNFFERIVWQCVEAGIVDGGKRYGFDRSRWRGLWRMEIQELLICAVQNIQVLVNKAWQRPMAQANRQKSKNGGFLSSIWLFRLTFTDYRANLRHLQPAQLCMWVWGIV